MRRVVKWRSLLFFRGVQPGEIQRMDYFELRYWGEMAEIQAEAEKNAAKPKQ
jgi:hypothetical protein